MVMKISKINKISNPSDTLKTFCDALALKASSESFIEKALINFVEDLKKDAVNNYDANQDKVIGSITDLNLIDLLAEQIYLETLIEACESKILSAKLRQKTVKNRFKQIVCDRFELPDDEPIKVDLGNMKILRGDREERISRLKNQIEGILASDGETLKEILHKEGKGTPEGDLAELIMDGHREKVVALCDEVFKADKQDGEFLEKVIDDKDVPKPIRYIADFVRKERGIECWKKKIIEWR
jgi:hypothetical protein